MNILYVIGNLNSGGAERQILLNASISSKKHNVLIVSIGNENNYVDFCDKNNLHVISLKKRKGKIWNLFILLQIYRIIKKNNIKLLHSFLGVPNLISYILSFFTKIHLITSWRSDVDLNSELWKRKGSNNKVLKNYNSKDSLLNKIKYLNKLTFHGKIWLPLERLIIDRSNLVIFNSAMSLSNHQKLFDLDLSKLRLVPNIVDTNFFSGVSKENKDKVRKNLKLEKDATVFLCISRIVPKKNQIFLVKNFIEFQKKKKNENFQLIICGQPDFGYKKKLQLAIGNNKKILLIQQTSEINKLYQASDCFIFPSKWYEANPNVLLESMSTGLYPIVSKTADPLNIIKHNTNGMIFDANNGNDLIRCMVKFTNMNRNELSEVLIKNKRLIKNNFSENSIKDKLMDVYRELQ